MDICTIARARERDDNRGMSKTTITGASMTITIADQARNFITDYTQLPNEAYADILALYTIHTHAFTDGTARTTPYIYITSQGPGSGKTRVLEVMQEICRDSNMFSGMTGPVMFRMIEAVKPTLFLDEVDTIYSGSKNEELRGVLNSGYKHNGFIPRVDPKAEQGFRKFSTFCPKVLAGIDNGQVPDTVLDRSIQITMVKAKPGEVKPFYADDVEDVAADLLDDITTWVEANKHALKDRANRPDAIDGLSDRQNDIIRPLLTIADQLGGEWPKRARMAFLRAFSDADTPLSPQAAALATVRDYMVGHNLDKITSARVAELVGQNGKQVSAWFTAFGIKPGTYDFKNAPADSKTADQNANNTQNAKGYKMGTAMTDAFDRFLPAIPEQVK
jgi:Protein of unknown function (DUF3631)